MSSGQIAGRLQAHDDVKLADGSPYQRSSRGPNATPAKVHSAIVPPGQTATNGMNRPCSEARRPSRAARTGNGTGANKVRKRGSSHCKNGERERYDSDDWDREQAESISIAPNATKTAEVFAPRRGGPALSGRSTQGRRPRLQKREFYEEKQRAGHHQICADTQSGERVSGDTIEPAASAT